jgi:hypothetical protein
MVLTSVLQVLSIYCHYARFDPVCSPRVRLCSDLECSSLVDHAAALRYGNVPSPLWASQLRWSSPTLDLGSTVHTITHTPSDASVLTSLWRSTGMTKVIFVRYIVALPDVC